MTKKTIVKRGATAVDKYVGARIRAGRLAADLSQAQLGNALGITFQQIQKYEKGTNRISCGMIVLAASALNVEIGWMFEGCPGITSKWNGKDSAATSVTQFFQQPGAAELAVDFVRLAPKARAVVRQLAGSL
jgi:transcriptional regulator with XRE-family HTH domain